MGTDQCGTQWRKPLIHREWQFGLGVGKPGIWFQISYSCAVWAQGNYFPSLSPQSPTSRWAGVRVRQHHEVTAPSPELPFIGSPCSPPLSRLGKGHEHRWRTHRWSGGRSACNKVSSVSSKGASGKRLHIISGQGRSQGGQCRNRIWPIPTPGRWAAALWESLQNETDVIVVQSYRGWHWNKHRCCSRSSQCTLRTGHCVIVACHMAGAAGVTSAFPSLRERRVSCLCPARRQTQGCPLQRVWALWGLSPVNTHVMVPPRGLVQDKTHSYP